MTGMQSTLETTGLDYSQAQKNKPGSKCHFTEIQIKLPISNVTCKG